VFQLDLITRSSSYRVTEIIDQSSRSKEKNVYFFGKMAGATSSGSFLICWFVRHRYCSKITVECPGNFLKDKTVVKAEADDILKAIRNHLLRKISHF